MIIEALEIIREALITERDGLQAKVDKGKQELENIADSIFNVKIYIWSAEAHLAMATDEDERYDWQSVILDLTIHLGIIEADYEIKETSIASDEKRIEEINNEIEQIDIAILMLKLAALFF